MIYTCHSKEFLTKIWTLAFRMSILVILLSFIKAPLAIAATHLVPKITQHIFSTTLSRFDNYNLQIQFVKILQLNGILKKPRTKQLDY